MTHQGEVSAEGPVGPVRLQHVRAVPHAPLASEWTHEDGIAAAMWPLM